MKQSDLVRITGLSKATISRIADPHRNYYYIPKLQSTFAIALAFQLGEEETKELFSAAYPWLETCKQSILGKISYEDTMEKLDNLGLPLLKDEG